MTDSRSRKTRWGWGRTGPSRLCRPRGDLDEERGRSGGEELEVAGDGVGEREDVDARDGRIGRVGRGARAARRRVGGS